MYGPCRKKITNPFEINLTVKNLMISVPPNLLWETPDDRNWCFQRQIKQNTINDPLTSDSYGSISCQKSIQVEIPRCIYLHIHISVTRHPFCNHKMSIGPIFPSWWTPQHLTSHLPVGILCVGLELWNSLQHRLPQTVVLPSQASCGVQYESLLPRLSKIYSIPAAGKVVNWDNLFVVAQAEIWFRSSIEWKLQTERWHVKWSIWRNMKMALPRLSFDPVTISRFPEEFLPR